MTDNRRLLEVTRHAVHSIPENPKRLTGQVSGIPSKTRVNQATPAVLCVGCEGILSTIWKHHFWFLRPETLYFPPCELVKEVYTSVVTNRYQTQTQTHTHTHTNTHTSLCCSWSMLLRMSASLVAWSCCLRECQWLAAVREKTEETEKQNCEATKSRTKFE